MRRVLTTCTLLAFAGVATATAQTVWITAGGASVSFQERNEEVQFDGFGFGGAAGLRLGPLSLEGEGYIATLDPDDETALTQSAKLKQIDVRLGWDVVSAITVQVGASRRYADPEFTIPDVGFFRIGVKSEQPLSRIARVWVRGAYLVAPKFNTGGDAGFAFELGLGTWIGVPSGRVGVVAQYDFQRIDRSVGGQDFPVQLMVAKFGVQLGL